MNALFVLKFIYNTDTPFLNMYQKIGLILIIYDGTTYFDQTLQLHV